MIKFNNKKDFIIIWVFLFIFFFLIFEILDFYPGVLSNILYSILTSGILIIFIYWRKFSGEIRNPFQYLILIWMFLNLIWFWHLYEVKGNWNLIKPFQYYSVLGFTTLYVFLLYGMSKKAKFKQKIKSKTGN